MLFARPSRFVLARRLMHRCREPRIAPPPAASPRNHEPLIGSRELECLFPGFVVKHDRSHWHLQNDVATVTSGLVRSFTVTSTFCLMLGIEAEMYERVVALT